MRMRSSIFAVKAVCVSFLAAVVLGAAGNGAAGGDTDSNERLPLLVQVPWGDEYPDLEPFTVEDITDALFRLLPLDPGRQGFTGGEPPQVGEWRAVLRVTGGLGEGVVWVALQVRGNEGRASVVVAKVRQRPTSDKILVTRRAIEKYIEVTNVPPEAISRPRIQELLAAVNYCRRGSEPLVLGSLNWWVFDLPGVEVRMVGAGDEAYLKFFDPRNRYRLRILEAVRDLVPPGLLPFQIRELEDARPGPTHAGDHGQRERGVTP